MGHDCGAVSAYPLEVQHDEVFVTVPVLVAEDGDATVVSGVSADAEVTPP